MKAIIPCVEFDDILKITLPLNAWHFSKILIVTSHDDYRTQQYVKSLRDPKIAIFATNAFYRDGAPFNLGAALELGFDALGRSGWICRMDADIILPKNLSWSGVHPGYLYTPRRHILREIREHANVDWSILPIREEAGFWGYCQVFHASDSVLPLPWYGQDSVHAGGSDGYFSDHWPAHKKLRPNWNVLRLGPTNKNWAGRTIDRLDGVSFDTRKRRYMMNYINGDMAKEQGKEIL